MPIGNTAAAPALTAQQQNAMARQYVLANAVNEWLQIYSQVLTGTIAGQQVNIPVRNVGLIKRFWVQTKFTLVQAAAETLTLSELGTSAIYSQVILTDLNNQTRINTAGWHLQAVASAKQRFPFASAIGISSSSQATDNPFGYGINYTSIQSAASSVSNVSSTITASFEVPVAYSDHDLRGGIYANVVNATMNLQLTVNPNIIVGSTATDPASLFNVYKSSTAGNLGTISAFTVTVYQNILDQIPIGQKGPILPGLDLSTAYMLQNTSNTGLTQNSDFQIPYANYRDFLSTTAIYDNAGTFNAGTDIAYWALQSANYTNLWKVDPNTAAEWGRLRLKIDFPKGMYYFDHRDKPIATVQYGNMALVINASSVTSGATVYIGYEMLALINQVTQAGSLYGN